MRIFFFRELLLAAIIAAIVIVGDYMTSGSIRNFVYKYTGSLTLGIDDVVTSGTDFFGGFSRIDAMVSENKELENLLEEIDARDIIISELKNENEELREQAQIGNRIDAELREVGILQVQRTSNSSAIIIDAGASDGVVVSSPVIKSGNILLGVVKEVFEDTSLVLLTDDPRLQISVQILDTNILAHSVGMLDDTIALDLITNQDDVKEGDMVVTSGLDTLPPYLLIGKVSDVEKKEGALFQNVTVTSYFDASNVKKIFVVL